MSKNAIFENHEKFENNIQNIIKYGLEIVDNKLPYKLEKKSNEEKSMLLEALVLRSCSLWASFVENEVILLANLDSSKLKNEMGLPQKTKLNLKLIRALLFSDSYRSYYNVEHSKSEFKKIFAEEYNLFNEIQNEQIKNISFVFKIRNYLSHYSAFSRKQLFIAYQKVFNYKRFLEPGQFLMKQEGKSFEKLIHNFKMVSIVMKNKLK